MGRKLFITSCICMSLLSGVSAQVVNTGQPISISAGGIVFIDDSYIHNAGSITDDGEITLKGNWSNHSGSPAFDPKSSGMVRLAGGQQKIGGSSKTAFPNLMISGTDYKKLDADIDILGILDLNDRELKANQYSLNILNPNVNAISRSSGFISTDKKGKLSRNTSSPVSYLFPFGSSATGTPIYRPISIDPKSTTDRTYSGSFFNEDPTLGGYDKNTKRQDIDKIFDKYFYVLNFDSGLGATDIKFFQNTADGDHKQLIKWGAPGIWEKAAPSTPTDGTFGEGLNRQLLFSTQEKFKSLPFSFSNAASAIDPLTLFNAFSPDGDGKNDTWVVKNLDLYPNNELLIFNRWGDEVFKAKSYGSNNAWDGANLQPGTYFYVLNVEISGERKVYKGFISMAKKN